MYFLSSLGYATSGSGTTEFGSGLASIRSRIYWSKIMKGLVSPPSPLTNDERLRLAQQAYGEYRTRCFWFMPKDLVVTQENFPLIIEGLKLDGGHKGWKLAHSLCR